MYRARSFFAERDLRVDLPARFQTEDITRHSGKSSLSVSSYSSSQVYGQSSSPTLVPIAPMDCDEMRHQLMKDAIQCIYRDNPLWLKLMTNGPAKQLHQIACDASLSLIDLEKQRVLYMCKLSIVESHVQSVRHFLGHLEKYDYMTIRNAWICDWELAVDEAVSKFRLQVVMAKKSWPNGFEILPLTPLLADAIVSDFEDTIRKKLRHFSTFLLEKRSFSICGLTKERRTKRFLNSLLRSLEDIQCSCRSRLEWIEQEIHDTMDREGMKTLSYSEKVFKTAAKVLYVLLVRNPSAVPDRFSFAYIQAKSRVSPRPRSDKDMHSAIIPRLEFMLYHEIKGLLENSVKLWWTDEDGNTLLHHAVMGKKDDMVKYLLEQGASLCLFNNQGMSPLHLAFYSSKDVLRSIYAASELDPFMTTLCSLRTTRWDFFKAVEDLLNHMETEMKKGLYRYLISTETKDERRKTISIVRGKLAECRTQGHASVLLSYIKDSVQAIPHTRNSGKTNPVHESRLIEALIRLLGKFIAHPPGANTMDAAESVLGLKGLDTDIDALQQKLFPVLEGVEASALALVHTPYATHRLTEQDLTELSGECKSEFFYEVEL